MILLVDEHRFTAAPVVPAMPVCVAAFTLSAFNALTL
jgi:hypothetical protein